MSSPPHGTSPVHAAASISAGGITAIAAFGLEAPGSHVTGNYSVTLKQPIDAAECVCMVTFRDVAGLDHTAAVTHTSDSQKSIAVVDGAGAPADAAFDLLIIRTRVG